MLAVATAAFFLCGVEENETGMCRSSFWIPARSEAVLDLAAAELGTWSFSFRFGGELDGEGDGECLEELPGGWMDGWMDGDDGGGWKW